MPIRIDCPRCNKPLAVPSKKAGSYVTCPRCQGRLWVPALAGDQGVWPEGRPPGAGSGPPNPGGLMAPAAAPSGAVAGPMGGVPLATPPPVVPEIGVPAVPPGSPPAAGPAAPPPPGAPAPAVMGAAHGAPSQGAFPGPGAPAMAAPPPVAAIPRRKVPRFVTSEPSACHLPVTADGKLPELKLGESEGRPADKPAHPRGMHPLVLFGLLAASLCASLLLIFAPLDSTAPARIQQRQQARRVIETEYFRELDEGVPPRPYQLLLREAKLAHSRGDFQRERQMYRRVLDLLRAYPKPEKGITGSPERDEELERQLIILLSQ